MDKITEADRQIKTFEEVKSLERINVYKDIIMIAMNPCENSRSNKDILWISDSKSEHNPELKYTPEKGFILLKTVEKNDPYKETGKRSRYLNSFEIFEHNKDKNGVDIGPLFEHAVSVKREKSRKGIRTHSFLKIKRTKETWERILDFITKTKDYDYAMTFLNSEYTQSVAHETAKKAMTELKYQMCTMLAGNTEEDPSKIVLLRAVLLILLVKTKKEKRALINEVKRELQLRKQSQPNAFGKVMPKYGDLADALGQDIDSLYDLIDCLEEMIDVIRDGEIKEEKVCEK